VGWGWIEGGIGVLDWIGAVHGGGVSSDSDAGG
jgi:hypothetical protein